MEEWGDGNRLGGKGFVELVEFGVRTPMGEDFFGFLELCRNVSPKFTLLDRLDA
jgi:hypothetical protein